MKQQEDAVGTKLVCWWWWKMILGRDLKKFDHRVRHRVVWQSNVVDWWTKLTTRLETDDLSRFLYFIFWWVVLVVSQGKKKKRTNLSTNTENDGSCDTKKRRRGYKKKRQQESNARLRGMGSIMMRFFSHLFGLTKHARHQLEEWFSLCGVDW